MKKIIAKKAFAGSLMSLYALGLLGCKFKPATNIPKSIDPVTVTEIDNEEVVYFDDLKDINVYFDYYIHNDTIMYGSSVLKEVDTDDYTAYYNYRNGNLVSVVFNNTLSAEDKIYYRNYINTNYIKVSSLEEQLYNPGNTKLIKKGINYSESYVDYDTLKLMEASIIPHNKQVFSNTLDEVYEQKTLKR